jgi:hypothetical protein
MQPPSTNPGNTKSTNASPDLGKACSPKRYIGPICLSKSAKIKALKAKIEAKTDQNQDCENITRLHPWDA